MRRPGGQDRTRAGCVRPGRMAAHRFGVVVAHAAGAGAPGAPLRPGAGLVSRSHPAGCLAARAKDRIPFGRSVEGRKAFFFEKNKQKAFDLFACTTARDSSAGAVLAEVSRALPQAWKTEVGHLY